MKFKKALFSTIGFPLLLTSPALFATSTDDINITLEQVTKDVTYLASDSLEGRANYSAGLTEAANYIAERFKSSGLKPFNNDSNDHNSSFLQSFSIKVYAANDITIKIGNVLVNKADMAMVSTAAITDWELDSNKQSNVVLHTISKEDNFRSVIKEINATGGEHFVAVAPEHKEIFSRYQAYFARGITKLDNKKDNNSQQGGTIVLVMTEENISSSAIKVTATTTIEKKSLANVVAVLQGTSHPEEIILYSAHYDHLGVKNNPDENDQDIIYNGADDDASGTSAVINLAQYFAKQGNNKRTLMFVAFSAEEIGGYGSQYFSKQVSPESIKAMINIEMIGKPSKFGAGTLWMTGMERSTLGESLNKELKPYNMEIHTDPYPKQGLFYRSDNATLARQGVPAHSFSSTQLDKDQHYHNVSDDIESLDLQSMHKVIQSLAIATQPLVDAKITPSRIDKATVKNKGKIF